MKAVPAMEKTATARPSADGAGADMAAEAAPVARLQKGAALVRLKRALVESDADELLGAAVDSPVAELKRKKKEAAEKEHGTGVDDTSLLHGDPPVDEAVAGASDSAAKMDPTVLAPYDYGYYTDEEVEVCRNFSPSLRCEFVVSRSSNCGLI